MHSMSELLKCPTEADMPNPCSSALDRSCYDRWGTKWLSNLPKDDTQPVSDVTGIWTQIRGLN